MLRAFKESVKHSEAFRAWQEWRLRRDETERFSGEARVMMASLPNPEATWKKYEGDLSRHMFTYPEWLMYGFEGATREAKEAFISRSEAQKWYRRLIRPEIRALFNLKPLFLHRFAPYIHRRFLAVGPGTTVEELEAALLPGKSYIAKPQAGTLGRGVHKLCFDSLSHDDYERLLAEFKAEGTLLEETIAGGDALQSFHPASLNTIRVMSANRGTGRPELFASFVRFGRGDSVVDNAHAGGIFCTVDIASGRILSDGMDSEGRVYTEHPDTGLPFRGFQIPQWADIERACTEAHASVDIPFVGWDVCINAAGEVEFIEGNHAADVDIIQAPLRVGYRERFEKVCRDYIRSKQ